VTESGYSNIDSYCLLPKSYLIYSPNKIFQITDTTDLKEIEKNIHNTSNKVKAFLTQMKKFLNEFIPNIKCE
jgi:hypothetical protein